ncbi:MAG: putative Beta-xylosidase [Polyangiaceae bacterium]|nr:putative Beta-xylosidase [Polyangiaceae bacterium]
MHRGGLFRSALVAAALSHAGCAADPDVVAVAVAPPTPELLELAGDIAVSDPSALHDGDDYWVISTGEQLPIRRSPDLRAFERVGGAFEQLPAWVAEEVPEASTFWSPDLAYFNGQYHLYYAVSTLGDNQSCIGHATAEALPSLGEWADRGPVICSTRADNWNAIDPNVLQDEQGTHWLVLGSFRSGIKLIGLDEEGMRAGADLIPLAKRQDIGIQAPALAHRDGWYYLFASLGAGDEHALIVGRSASIRGPYLDREGLDLWEGGGSLLLEAGDRYRGPGSNDVLDVDGQHYNFFHSYDSEDANEARLRVSTLVWDREGFPISAGP